MPVWTWIVKSPLPLELEIFSQSIYHLSQVFGSQSLFGAIQNHIIWAFIFSIKIKMGGQLTFFPQLNSLDSFLHYAFNFNFYCLEVWSEAIPCNKTFNCGMDKSCWLGINVAKFKNKLKFVLKYDPHLLQFPN